MNHPLTVVSHGARRAPVTRMTIRSEDFMSSGAPAGIPFIYFI